MKSWKDVMFDEESMWPGHGLVTVDAEHADDRGVIKSLVDFPMKNISLILSKKGSVRSNHYHLTNWHYMYVLSGTFDYYYRAAGSQDQPAKLRLSVGEMVFTPPMEEHATVFLEDTQLLVMSRNPRDQASYEADVRRVMLVDQATASELTDAFDRDRHHE